MCTHGSVYEREQRCGYRAYQANVLGGGGVVNGALTMVPPRTDFNEMARYNWSYEDINPHFKQILGYMQAVNVPSADGLRYLEMPSDVSICWHLQNLNCCPGA